MGKTLQQSAIYCDLLRRENELRVVGLVCVRRSSCRKYLRGRASTIRTRRTSTVVERLPAERFLMNLQRTKRCFSLSVLVLTFVALLIFVPRFLSSPVFKTRKTSPR